MIYLVITLDGKNFSPTIKAFTNKKDAKAYEIEQNEFSLQVERETGYELKIFTRVIPWKKHQKRIYSICQSLFAIKQQEETMEILIYIAMYIIKPTLFTLMILSTIGAIIIITKSQ